MANTIFGYKQIHTYTWERTEGKSMIDLFLVDQRIRSQVMGTRVFRVYDLGTDHYLVVARIRSLAQAGEVSRLGVELAHKKLEASRPTD